MMRLGSSFATLLIGCFITGAFGETLDDRIAELARKGEIASTHALVGQNGGPNSPAGGTALFHAIVGSQRELVESLLNGGADPNRQSANRHLPLLIAIGNRDPNTVASLLHHGADPNRIGRCLENDCPGHPSLVYAAYCAEPTLVKQLLEAGADVTWNKDRASSYANLNHDTETLKLLRAAGSREDFIAGEASSASSSVTGVSALGLTELLPSAERAAIRPAPDAKCRVAIIASEELTAAGDLLTVQLAKEPSLVVVERNELDRILGEQKLTRSFAADAAQAAKVGALLRADALLLLEKRAVGSARIVQARFVRVHPGLVLDTTSALDPIASPDAWADSLAHRVVPLASKALAPDAVALSIVGLRSSAGTAAGRNLESACSLLLTDRLVREPRIHVLERTAIDELSREHAFGSAGEFWAGSWLLDGTVEPAPDNSGLLSLSLRLRPAQGGEPVLVNVHGLKSQLPALVADAGVQIARALIKQPVAAATDLAAEARRYLDEAKSAMNCHMYLTAHRAVETAWLLGLQNFETARLRVLAGARALQWQYTRMRVDPHSSIDTVRGRAWNAAAMNRLLGGQPWATQREFLDLAIRDVSAWREGVAKLAEATPAEAAEYVEFINDLVEGTALTFLIFDTAAGEIDYGTQLAELAAAFREMLDDAQSLAEQRQDVAQAAGIVAIARTTLARFLYPEETAVGAVLRGELEKHFAEHDPLTRAKIRELVAFSGSSYILRLYSFEPHSGGTNMSFRMPSGSIVRDALLKSLNASAAPEDQFLAHFVALRAETVPAKQREHGKRLFELVWEMRNFFASDPGATEPYSSQFSALERTPGAKEFAHVPFGEDSSSLRPSAEMHALNVKMRLYLIEHFPLGVMDLGFVFLDGSDSPEEAAAVTAAWRAHTQKGKAAGLGKSTVFIPQKVEPDRGTVPSTAPPLRISRLWFPTGAGSNEDDDVETQIETLRVEGDHFWIYGSRIEFGVRGHLHGYLFRVELPSLATTVLPMPVAAFSGTSMNSENDKVNLVITADYIICAREGRDFSTYDRKAQSWTTNEEIKPFGWLVWTPGRVYQLTRSDGVDTLLRIDPARHSAEILASTQRVPPVTPADDSAFQYNVVRARSTEELELVVAVRGTPFARGEMPRVREKTKVANFLYSIPTGQWTTKAPLHDGSGLELFSTFSNSYPPAPRRDSPTLKLHSLGTASDITFPVEFVTSPDAARLGMLPSPGFPVERCVTTPRWHFLAKWPGRGLWLLPQADLDDYLRANLPATPPVPTPPPVK